MRGCLFQNWTTIRAGDHSVTNLPQAEASWLDVGVASDVALFLQIAQVTGGSSPTIFYDTSPNRDASLFKEMASVSLVNGAAPIITRVELYANPAVPIARWLRWRVYSGATVSTWDVTFRITAMLYPR